MKKLIVSMKTTDDMFSDFKKIASQIKMSRGYETFICAIQVESLGQRNTNRFGLSEKLNGVFPSLTAQT